MYPPQKRSSKLFLIVCEKNSREHEYFGPFMNKYNRIRLRHYPNYSLEEFDELDSEFGLYKLKLKIVISEVAVQKQDEVWILMDTDKNFDGDKIEEIRELLDNQFNYNYAFSNPCFEIWLYHLKGFSSNKSLNCEQLKKQNGMIPRERKADDIKKAIIQVRKIDVENRGDGTNIPCPMSSTIDHLMEKLLEQEW